MWPLEVCGDLSTWPWAVVTVLSSPTSLFCLGDRWKGIFGDWKSLQAAVGVLVWGSPNHVLRTVCVLTPPRPSSCPALFCPSYSAFDGGLKRNVPIGSGM